MPVLNPYHFVPVKPKRHNDDLKVEEFISGESHVTHDKCVLNTHSGRLICKLTTRSPIFVGGKRERNGTIQRPAESAHFSLPNESANKGFQSPAIPSTSIRGVISSIAESLANSSLRVLSDEMYSYRKTPSKDSLSAIGMITIKYDNNELQYELKPLTLPTLDIDGNSSITISDPTIKKLFTVPNLKVYIGDQNSIKDENFYRTYRQDKQEYFWMELVERSWNQSDGLDFDTNMHCKYRKGGIQNGGYLLGQSPLNSTIWKIKPENKDTKYTRGIIRVLGCWGERKKTIPLTKYHEVFIPYPENADKDWPTYKISSEAIERFYDLADQRTNDEKEILLPYEPKDTIRNLDSSDRRFRLKEGDLVYFKHDGQTITEISLSSVWRGRVEKIINGELTKATTYDFFRQISTEQNRMNEELLPFNSNRQYVTLAEQIFGFVQQDKVNRLQSENKLNPAPDEKILSLAGRVWFSHAKMHHYVGSTPYLPFVTLKILDSPKPPCPSMYFVDKNVKNPVFIAKNDLNPMSHRPQGRKYYLHHQTATRSNDPDQPWRSDYQWNEAGPLQEKHSFKQQIRVTPVKAQTTFYFHIDFDNLSSIELGLLLCALEPSSRFRHKIGMGKAIGLGSVKIETVGYFKIDRSNRYTYSGLFKPRYSQFWAHNQNKWPDRYKKLSGTESVDKPELLQQLFLDSIKKDYKDILKAFELIGENDYENVHTPKVDNGKSEKETFKWFVINDRGTNDDKAHTPVEQQFLSPLTQHSSKINELIEHQQRKTSNDNKK